MDLVRIFHVVDTPSSDKRDFNHIYVVGFVQSLLIHLDTVLLNQFSLVFFLSLSGVHPMFMFGCISTSFVIFLLCMSFLRSKVLSCIQWICVVSHPSFGIHG